MRCSDSTPNSDIPSAYEARGDMRFQHLDQPDFPIPASPDKSTTCPCPALACSHRSRSSVTSDSRPTSGVSPLSQPHRDAPWLHFPGGRGTLGQAQQHLEVSVPLTLHSQNTPAPSDMTLRLWPPYWPQQDLRCAKQCWVLPLGLIVPDALALPCPPQRPGQYGCPDGQRVGYLSFVVDGIEVSQPQGYPTLSVQHVGHHPHGRGDSQNRRTDRHQTVERYAHRRLDNVGTNLLIIAHHVSQVFRVELGGKARRVHQVTEHHRELAAFRLRGGGGRLGECRLRQVGLLGGGRLRRMVERGGGVRDACHPPTPTRCPSSSLPAVAPRGVRP